MHRELRTLDQKKKTNGNVQGRLRIKELGIMAK